MSDRVRLLGFLGVLALLLVLSYAVGWSLRSTLGSTLGYDDPRAPEHGHEMTR